MTEAYLALGSNMEDRLAYLSAAEAMLNAHDKIQILKTSTVYETQPWPREDHDSGHPHAEKGQKWFLNQVIKISTSLSPQELLSETQAIEKKIGRTKKHHWGPREIDIDILLYGNQIVDSPDLTIPHRHIEDRQFVLVPLVEIAPELMDPMTKRNFKQILEEAKKIDDHKVTPFL